MLDLSKVTAVVQEVLTNAMSESTVTRSDWINDNPGLCPWVGVYKAQVGYSPESLGRGPNRWRALITMDVVIQEYSSNSGEECEDLLEAQVKKALDTLEANWTLNGQVEMINSINVTYSAHEDVEEDQHYQMARLAIEWQVGAGA